MKIVRALCNLLSKARLQALLESRCAVNEFGLMNRGQNLRGIYDNVVRNMFEVKAGVKWSESMAQAKAGISSHLGSASS